MNRCIRQIDALARQHRYARVFRGRFAVLAMAALVYDATPMREEGAALKLAAESLWCHMRDFQGCDVTCKLTLREHTLVVAVREYAHDGNGSRLGQAAMRFARGVEA